jgi:hypothetical protein
MRGVKPESVERTQKKTGKIKCHEPAFLCTGKILIIVA